MAWVVVECFPPVSETLPGLVIFDGEGFLIGLLIEKAPSVTDRSESGR